MPLGDDTGRILTREDPATPQEMLAIRLELNKLQLQVSKFSALLDTHGNLNPDALAKGNFSVLPHDGAGFYNSVAQAVPTGEVTKLTFEADSGLTAMEARYAGNWGLVRDVANHRIKVSGRPGKSIFLVIAGINWETNDDITAMYVKETATSDQILLDSKEGIGLNHGSVLRECVSDVEYWELHGYHDNAGNLNANACYLQVMRLR